MLIDKHTQKNSDFKTSSALNPTKQPGERAY